MIIRAGCVYLVGDKEVSMPPETNRTTHPQRTVLIVSGDAHNADERWPIVLVCPVSSGATSCVHDVRVGAGMAGLTKKGFVRVALVQPFEKKNLGDLLSVTPLPASVLREVHAHLVAYMQPSI